MEGWTIFYPIAARCVSFETHSNIYLIFNVAKRMSGARAFNIVDIEKPPI